MRAQARARLFQAVRMSQKKDGKNHECRGQRGSGAISQHGEPGLALPDLPPPLPVHRNSGEPAASQQDGQGGNNQ